MILISESGMFGISPCLCLFRSIMIFLHSKLSCIILYITGLNWPILYSFQIIACNKFLISNTIIISCLQFILLYSINDSTNIFFGVLHVNWRNQLAISPYNIFSNPDRFSTLYVNSINMLHHIQGKITPKPTVFFQNQLIYIFILISGYSKISY